MAVPQRRWYFATACHVHKVKTNTRIVPVLKFPADYKIHNAKSLII